jgi:hypothetical protein
LSQNPALSIIQKITAKYMKGAKHDSAEIPYESSFSLPLPGR